MMVKECNLKEVQNTMSNILTRCKLDSFLTVDTIMTWLTNLETKESKSSLSMITGLLDEETLQDEDIVNELLSTMIRLYHFLPLKSLDGQRYVDILKQREARNEPTRIMNIEMSLPPHEWRTSYEKAFLLMQRQQFSKAATTLEQTFKKLLDLQTTDREIYRVFCNAGVAHVLSGDVALGEYCFRTAQQLNPQYAFASEQLHKLKEGDFDSCLRLGVIKQMCDNFDEIRRRPSYLDLRVVMRWPEHKVLDTLASYGVTVNKHEFIEVAKTVNQPEELAEKIWYPHATVSGQDEDFLWIAAYALWAIYCPNEPSVPGLNKAIHDAYLRLSARKKRGSLEPIAYALQTISDFILCHKEGFLQQWHKTYEIDCDPGFELKTILATLMALPETKADALNIVHRLTREIPHPDWESVMILDALRTDDPTWKKRYEDLRRSTPIIATLLAISLSISPSKMTWVQPRPTFWMLSPLLMPEPKKICR